MPAFKNQHFVPRVHLKPFSVQGEGLAISLYNSGSQRIIHNAPTKHQCSRDYFYGEAGDVALEDNLKELEGRYGTLVQELVGASASRESVSRQTVAWLRLFWAVQWARTEAAEEEAKQLSLRAASIFEIPQLAEAPPGNKWVLIPLSLFAKAYEHATDLQHVFVRNQTQTPFITSDNPAAVTSKLHILDKRAQHVAFGIGSAGAILFLPLTPHIALIFYDADVYKVDDRNGWVDVTRACDIDAINEHQILNCRSNVYFSSHHSFDWIPLAFDRFAEQRAQELWKYEYAVLHSEKNGTKTYKVVPARDAENDREALIKYSAIQRHPAGWPSFLRWRPRGRAFDTGTGAGIVRAKYVRENPLVRCRPFRIDK
ncbi:DUF4238 domain-containing protein [Lysobacter capsici]|uniref:DUF4238 domain-containing protein n=1 Tax=Lysobacter capsici TaxID=435897 RepID=UPI001BFFEE94|nr:DUF4238 domain-containing protein [Lysobacter capsici]QWF19232.1 DUF4238 domain-containing protein [Lysobacter capsici]